MSLTREEILAERRRLKADYRELFDEVSALLFRHDPAGINFDSNDDEYELEAGTILPRLRDCNSAGEVRRVVHEELVRWFDAGIVGQEERHGAMATEIWECWQRFKAA